MNGTLVNWLGVSLRLARIATGRRNRGGVSLMEVLISIFVLSIGLMGVAALIPVGRFSLVETGKADRSAACGRAALREIKVRKMLERTRTATDNPAQEVDMWLQPGNTSFDPADVKPTGHPATVIDPLFVAIAMDVAGKDVTNADVNTIGSFPYCYYVAFASGAAWRVPRLTLRKTPTTSLSSMHRFVADRIFTWQDDMVFYRPEDDDERPELLVDGSGVRPIEGNYSWMVMVTPSSGNENLCAVSVIVFYKRNFQVTSTLTNIDSDNPKPSERVAVATFPPGGGYGGGDVELAIPSNVAANLPGTEDKGEYLDVKENDWLMLTNGKVFLWYRVVAVANELTTSTTSGRLVRHVTLAGPDWNCDTDPAKTWCVNLDNLPNATTLNDAQAVICDEVVGVYTQTIDLDTAEGWSR